MDINKLLKIARTAALKAGEAILEIYDSGNFEIEIKSDNSPLTRADRAAHKIIKEDLAQTGLPLLSEEGKSIPYEERKSWEFFWLVDPLDGTKEFIKRTNEFTVNIALVKRNVPIAGIVYAPKLDMLYCGSKDTGVVRIKNGEQTQLAPAKQKRTLEELREKETVTVVASRSHNNEATVSFINQFPNVEMKSMGSALKLMLIADGSADIYPRLGPTMEWDTAAGDAILRALNMCAFQTDMVSPLAYNKPDLLNPYFIAM